uniref:Uncharacterized protein n=1 Tax=Acrobeloides nanus TaxID=290746 RepID=A0A914D3J5_9BILA
MGQCQSEEEKALAMKTQSIDQEIRQTRSENEKIIKLLLLGTDECGKSTILKQMKILHDNGFTEEEKSLQKCVVYKIVIDSMITILVGMKMLQIQFEDMSLEKEAKIVYEFAQSRQLDTYERIYPELCDALKNLWNDEEVCTKAIELANEYQLPECASYFLNSVERITQPDYKPTEQDILLSHKQTTGIVEVKFRMKGKDFQ